ncbi:MAG: LPS export ABC transporter permease LptG [Bacteroidetes bacterium]|nr:LPS export ABC transporter permease LptG [Bacteroidota bacterium]
MGVRRDARRNIEAGTLKKLDIYIIRQFVSVILFALLVFAAIFILVDVMEHLSDFLDHGVGLLLIARYYLVFTPEILKLITPVAVLLACLFTAGRMSNQNEIIIIKSSGINIYRLLLPFLLVSAIICGIMIYFNEWIVPMANHEKFRIEKVYLQEHREGWWKYNIFMLDGRNRVVSIGYFDDVTNTATKISVQDFADTNRTYLVKRYDAQMMTYYPMQHVWVLKNVIERTFDGTKQTFEVFPSLTLKEITFKPADLAQKELNPNDMNFDQLKRFIELQRRSGNDVARYEVDYYSKVSFPFATIIVVLFGVPLSARKKRSGLALEFGISILIAFIYLLVIKISQVLGYDGIVEPLLTAWLANIVFFAAALYNTAKVAR